MAAAAGREKPFWGAEPPRVPVAAPHRAPLRTAPRPAPAPRTPAAPAHRPGKARLGSAWLGLAWLGTARQGTARPLRVAPGSGCSVGNSGRAAERGAARAQGGRGLPEASPALGSRVWGVFPRRGEAGFKRSGARLVSAPGGGSPPARRLVTGVLGARRNEENPSRQGGELFPCLSVSPKLQFLAV